MSCLPDPASGSDTSEMMHNDRVEIEYTEAKSSDGAARLERAYIILFETALIGRLRRSPGFDSTRSDETR
jgi:hypothetical protein